MITGKYEISLKAPIGVLTATVDVTEENGAYSVVQTDANGPADGENVKVDGDTVTYVAQIKSPMGKMKLNMTLNINGDEVTGSAKMMMGTMDVTGKRIA